MSRPAKGARLYLRRERRYPNGLLKERATWIIRDGDRYIPTGCLAAQAQEAERRLGEYLADKYRPARRERDLDQIPCADVLSIYLDDTRPRQRNQVKFDERMIRLTEWWGDKKLSEVSGETCRDYVKHRGRDGGARRDLEDLRAAINHHARQGLHRGSVRVLLPEKGAPRDRWLTRQEAAKLIWTCWRTREIQRMTRGPLKGQQMPTDKRPLRHLARFILIGLYTGTRARAIASASPLPAIGRSYVDLDNGIFYRLAEGALPSKKRQTPAPLPTRLLAHMRRWKQRGIAKAHFVEFNKKPVKSVKTAFKRAVALSGIGGKSVSPHTLRHTAATWMMQQGADKWSAAGFLGMSVAMLDRVYGHHHPDYLKDAAHAIGYGRRGR
jgi:integrase